MRGSGTWLAAMAAVLLAAPASAAPPASPTPAVTPRIPPATIDDSLEVEGEGLAARQSRTRMALGVTVNGRGPFQFMVDSGADRTVIGAALAQRLALPAGDPVMLHSTTGTSAVATVHIDALRIGASEITDIAAPALPETFLGAQGLIGIDALADQRLLLDFDAKTITIQDTRHPAARGGSDEIVVTARRRNGQLILTQASADRVGIYAIIDSGSEVTMGNSALRARIFAHRRPPPVTPLEIVSVTGQTMIADLIVLPELTIGGIMFRDVPVAFDDAPPFALFGLAAQPAILLGTDLLRSFRRVSLDFRARRVRFSLRR